MKKSIWFLIVGLAISLVAAGAFLKMGNKTGISRWHYQLQEYESFLERARDMGNTLFVIDYSKDGTDAQAFSKEEIAGVQAAGNQVLSYLSIGESESVRWYYKGMPKDLKGAANPDWPDNFYVKFWDSRWREIIIGAPGRPGSLTRILEAGFDGVYLDIVDAYERYPGRKTGAAEMIEFIEMISRAGKSINPNFQVYPQNAPCITQRYYFEGMSDEKYQSIVERYWAAIDGIGLEDTFYYGDAEHDNPYQPQKYILDCLKEFQARGKPMLGVDYLRDPQKQTKALEEFRAAGILGLVTDRHLKGEFFRYGND